MHAKNFDQKFLLQMAHSKIGNYVIPGLSSSLIGNPSEAGTVRLFECSRDHQEGVTPHSHRFDLMCWVLQGEVINRTWKKALFGEKPFSDLYERSTLSFQGSIGQYEIERSTQYHYVSEDITYLAGECYSMDCTDIHSIFFARNTKVLFFEGPTKTNKSVILEPVVEGVKVPTFKVEGWMFNRDSKSA